MFRLIIFVNNLFKKKSMIQRIQTVFLFISTLLTLSMIFTPVSEIRLIDGEILRFYSISQKDITSPVNLVHSRFPILVLLSVVAAVSFLCIFFYKKRLLQMRLCIYNILMLALICGLILFNYYILQKIISVASPQFFLIIIIPVVNMLMLFLAYRAIHKDELLVKSNDRLR
jgi:hypothetical protein